jgi:hypothetical protein
MKLWRIPMTTTEAARAHRATQRDDVQGIGPEGYAEFNTMSRRRIAGWSVEPSQSPRQLEAAMADTSNTSRKPTTPPTDDDDASSKRPASTQPANQPGSKRARMFTRFGGDRAGSGVDDTDPPSSQHSQQLGGMITDDITTSSATTTPPAENVDATSKRPASAQPTDQPGSKRAKLSTPSPRHGRCADIASKRHALTQPAEQSDRKRVRVFIPADGTGGYGGFDEAPVPPTRYVNAAAKIEALAQLVGQPDVNVDRVFVPLDWRGGVTGFVETLTPFFPEVAPDLRASTDLPGENIPKPEQAEKDGVEGDVKGKVNEDKADKNKPGKNKDKIDKDKVGSDSDVCEVIENLSTPVLKGPKWKETAAAKSLSAKKSKGKKSEQLETPDAEDSPSARKSAVKASNSRGKTVTRATTVDESEAADEESEEDGEGEDEEEDDVSESEDEDLKVTKKKIAQANVQISKACRTCKIDANKEWGKKYSTMVSMLNSERKAVVKILKADAIAAVKKVKATADKEKKAAKAKADQEVEDVKDNCEDKFDTMKTKLDDEIKVLKKNLGAERVKVTGLKGQLERAEEIRKAIEKAAAEKVKKAEADLKSGALEQRERGKQLKRESQAGIDQWKPEHSKALKDKERIIKELTQAFLAKEKELEDCEEELRHVREQRSKDKNHHEHTLKKLEEKRARVNELERNILIYNRTIKAAEERNAADIARVQEHLATARANLQEQSNRVVDKQRNNYQLGDAMRLHAKTSEARKVEIERLKKELQAAQAQLGLAKDLDDFDESVVGVVKGEVVKGEAVKGEDIRGDATKGGTAEKAVVLE